LEQIYVDNMTSAWGKDVQLQEVKVYTSVTLEDVA